MKGSWGLLLAVCLCAPARAQLSQNQIDKFHRTLGNRIVAATILGGDFGLSGSIFKTSDADRVTIQKFGDGGDLGARRPLRDSSVRWQPRVQGGVGFLQADTDHYPAALSGAESNVRGFAVQLGGGARLWFGDRFNLAPTLMGMYGHTSDSFHPRGNAFAASIQPQARAQGLVDWTADTWTVRPALEAQALYFSSGSTFTFTTNPVYFHTESFRTSSPNVNVDGESGIWVNKLEADIPLRAKLFGRPLRTGGYLSRTEILGDLKDSLNGCGSFNELHSRVVLDMAGRLWKLEWAGLGASYLWCPGFTGESIAADLAFRF